MDIEKDAREAATNDVKVAFDEAYAELKGMDVWEVALLGPLGREALFRVMFQKGAIYGMTRATETASRVVKEVLTPGLEVTDDHSG